MLQALGIAALFLLMLMVDITENYGTIWGLLFLAVVIAAIVTFLKFLFNSIKKDLLESEYAKNAMRFLSFYELLPKKAFCFVTPDTMGAMIPDNGFGTIVSTYLSNSRDFKGWFLEKSAPFLGGERGIKLFNETPMFVKLHGNDEDYPVVYFFLSESNPQKQEEYVKAIKNAYKKTYKKGLNILQLHDY